ncbi:MAG: DUF4453 domain-containing protein [Dinoroseobacter sp.]|nr:DUF4453 domain-containing protein [Dinoroseobacter sp.]
MKRDLCAALFSVIAFLPGTALAGYCEDLWFTRNAILDRAGICFGTPLGQAVFDNTGCTGSSVNLAPQFISLVNRINEAEALVPCRIDTSKTQLDLKDLAIRQRLVALPIPEERGQGYGCVGWLGPAVSLLDNHDPQGQAVGRIDPGDTVYHFHLPVGDWSYVTTEAPGRVGLKSAGWIQRNWGTQNMCAQQAG